MASRRSLQEIRFSRRAAACCHASGRGLTDAAVCDAIANGRRHPTGNRGARGGRIIRFERIREGSSPAMLLVLAEVTAKACFALTVHVRRP